MIRKNIDTPMLLSTLWIFVMFNMIFRDLHEFLNEGFLEELTALKVSEFEMLFYALVLEIPIAMVLLSRIMTYKATKWGNVSAASIIMLGTLSTLPSADMDDIFFTIMNTMAFMAIIFTALKWSSISDTDVKEKTN